MSDRIRYKLLKNQLFYAGLISIILLLIFSFIGPFITHHSGLTQDLTNAFMNPDINYPMGTDYLGRDIMARVMKGGRISLFVGIFSTVISVIIGTLVGVIAGYSGGLIDTIISRLIDIMLAFPYLLIAIALAAAMKPGFTSVIIALVIIGWASIARLVRSRVIGIKECDYFNAARALGVGRIRIMIWHIIPNCFSTILVIFSLKIGTMILIESALSFLGLSGAGEIESWGALVSRGVTYIDRTVWLSIFPGAAIALTVLAFNLLGDALRDAFDPKLL